MSDEREFDPKYPRGIDWDYNEEQREKDEWDAIRATEGWVRDKEKGWVKAGSQEYDPNTEAEAAYERDCESRLAREQERQEHDWDGAGLCPATYGDPCRCQDEAWEDLNLDGREP